MPAPDVPTQLPTTEEELRAWSAFLDLSVWRDGQEITVVGTKGEVAIGSRQS